MNEAGLNAIGIDSHAEEEDPKLWEKVDNGEYNIVYITPEMALDPAGHFFKNSHKNTKFKRNLALVAINECHLIWEWVGFRKKFELIRSLRIILSTTPCAVLSATIIPNVAGIYAQLSVSNSQPFVTTSALVVATSILKSTDG